MFLLVLISFVVLLQENTMKQLLFLLLILFFGVFNVNAQWSIDTTNVSNGFTGIDFVTNQIGYGTHASKVYKTNNSGETWQTVKPSSYSFLEDVIATSEDTAFAFGTYSYIYFTYNSGTTWDSVYFDSTTSILGAHAFSNNHIWFLGYRFDYTILYKTLDAGQSFTQDTIQGIIGCQDLEVTQKGRIYLGGMKVNFNDRSIVFSDNLGLTWNTLNAVNANQVLDIETFENTIMHTGSFGRVYTSLDSGNTFFDRSLPQSAAYVKIISDSLAFGFHSGSNYPKIFKSTNVGDTWQNVNIPFTGNISDAEQPYSDYPELIYLSVASYPYFYRYCDEVSLKLNSSLGYIITCGDTTQLSVNKYFKTYWSNGDTTSTTFVTNPGNYWVIGENICGNRDTINFQIAQIPIPIQVSNDTTICEGDSIQLTAFGGNTYAWSPSFGLNSISDSSVTAKPDSTISYTILISDTNTQCFRGDTINISVIPKVQIGLDSIEICYADTVIIEADSIQGYLYDWGFGTFPTLFRVGFLADTSIQINLSVTSQFGTCTFLDSIQVEVIQKPFSPNKNLVTCGSDTIIDTLNTGILQNISPFIGVSFLPSGNVVYYFPDSSVTFLLSMVDITSGCTYVDTARIEIDSLTKNSLTKNLVICSGDTVSDTLSFGFLQNISPNINVIFASGNNLVQYFPNTNSTFILNMLDTISGCNYFDSTTIEMDTTKQSLVNGIALSSTGSNLQGGLAYMINYNPIDSTVFAVDTALINTTGNFTLQSNLPKYFVKVVPDSTLHPFEIPTYYQNGTTFQLADSLLEDCRPLNIQISTIQGLNTAGSGFIEGNIYKGAGKTKQEPFIALPLLLTDTNFNVLRFTETDSLGFFTFKNLPNGNYFITGDQLSLNNQTPSKIEISNLQPILSGGVFNIVNGSINLSYVQSLKKFTLKSFVRFFPNPTNSMVWIFSNEQLLSIEVFNQFGQQVDLKTAIFNRSTTINLVDLTDGIYIFKVRSKNSLNIFKVIKQ